jgi:NAD(P)-dependent dehydrogenase (short-subunit alcohol dehydrogenase family)
MSGRITSPFGAFTPASEVAAGHDLSWRNVIVTGGASGIGVETARALADQGASVTIAARDTDAGRRVADDLNATAAGPAVEVGALELADLGSVRRFAQSWGDRPLDILINNAGVMACDQAYTAQGLEMQIGVNHFGHTLLTLLLQDNLKAGARGGRSARVVQLSSGGHRWSGMVWDDIHFRTRPYDRWQAYGQSKTANSLFGVGFTKRFADAGVTCNAVHPGGIQTPLQRHVTLEERRRLGWGEPDAAPSPNMKSVQQGASTTVWAALSPDLEGIGGLYLEDCAQAAPASDENVRGGVWPWALDEEAAERLWAVTEETLGL